MSRKSKASDHLDIDTVMEPEKTVRNVEAHSLQFDVPLQGYEIHLGRTTGPDCQRPTVRVNGTADGAPPKTESFWYYMHGLFGDGCIPDGIATFHGNRC